MSEIHNLFKYCSSELDKIHDKRERIVKLSRDITVLSKRMIFALHRDAGLKSETLHQTMTLQREIINAIQHVLDTEMKENGKLGHLFYKNYKSLAPGLEEFVEASLLLHWMQVKKSGKESLLSKEQVDNLLASDGSFSIPPTDYLLGIGDFTGELMRLCIAACATADEATAFSSLRLVQQIANEISIIDTSFRSKADTLNQSCRKMERACYQLRIRQIEAAHLSLPIASLISFTEEYINQSE
jgi:predicted translin family RNA/ssDNA-binding protein